MAVVVWSQPADPGAAADRAHGIPVAVGAVVVAGLIVPLAVIGPVGHPVIVIHVAVSVVVSAGGHHRLRVLDELLEVVLPAGRLVDGGDAVRGLREVVPSVGAVGAPDARVATSSQIGVVLITGLYGRLHLRVIALDRVLHAFLAPDWVCHRDHGRCDRQQHEPAGSHIPTSLPVFASAPNALAWSHCSRPQSIR